MDNSGYSGGHGHGDTGGRQCLCQKGEKVAANRNKASDRASGQIEIFLDNSRTDWYNPQYKMLRRCINIKIVTLVVFHKKRIGGFAHENYYFQPNDRHQPS